ncbi:MAG: hypothetical protein ABH816_03690 [Candidatus Levyibacteriota bacterium]
MKKLSTSKGFTLIELLVVVIVVIAIGGFVVSILFSTLRGTNKTNALTVVRQNGNGAISQMSKTIRNAKNIVDPISCIVTSSQNHITILTAEGNYLTYACCTSTTGDSNTLISINGDYTDGVCSLTERISLFDTSSVTLESCSSVSTSFTCSQNSNIDSPSVGIKFTLKNYAADSGVSLQENSALIPFQTSVVLRNLAR